MINEYIGAIQEERFEYKGFPCVVIMQAGCFRTGYVGIPKTHEKYGIHYNNLDIDCHGGLTYSNNTLIFQDDKDTWWIGFDTAHYGDGKDFESARELFKDYPKTLEQISHLEEVENMFPTYDMYASLDYCKNECMKIVEQLIN